MGKLNATIVLMIFMIVMVVTVEAKHKKSWIKCFRECSDSKHCKDDDGNCFERCKIKCGGPNPPHGPSSAPRILHERLSVDVHGRQQ
ncbi:unnamed protein product [Thlaspi arvense]|uniref:Plant thionin family protein n=1 Tax=Thlaspi arvense TaxID=13288 RepID=A0AAU9SRG0_THLAR|nr:unnamed protein product [Thlaspi arvense]